MVSKVKDADVKMEEAVSCSCGNWLSALVLLVLSSSASVIQTLSASMTVIGTSRNQRNRASLTPRAKEDNNADANPLAQNKTPSIKEGNTSASNNMPGSETRGIQTEMNSQGERREMERGKEMKETDRGEEKNRNKDRSSDSVGSTKSLIAPTSCLYLPGAVGLRRSPSERVTPRVWRTTEKLDDEMLRSDRRMSTER